VAEYRKLRGETPSAQEDGIAWARARVGLSLRHAREQAGLSQAKLGKKLKRSQTLIARAELGDLAVSERYVKAVLKACGLPADWSDATPSNASERRRRGRRAS
jgi:ribosome-binding protein aMBF1 (putative translation factor)